MTFPVGYHSLHPNVSMNFQMNRWFGWVGEPDTLEEMRMAAPRIATYADWKREFVALAERASQQGHALRAGFYWRSAEFFMRADDPERKSAREKFLEAMRSVYGPELGERHAVPYVDGRIRGFLPAYRFTPPRAKCTIVFFGGFDSYIEELTSAFIHLRDAGYDVIAFEGPGQGGALNDSGLSMTAQWHKPVGAVLDHFEVERAALVGLSLGGCLVMRAAAFEPRIERVVAFDILTNFLDPLLRQTRAPLRGLLKVLLRLRAARTCELDVRPSCPEKPGHAMGRPTRNARDRYNLGVWLPSSNEAIRDGRCLRVDQAGCSATGWKRRPLRNRTTGARGASEKEGDDEDERSGKHDRGAHGARKGHPGRRRERRDDRPALRALRHRVHRREPAPLPADVLHDAGLGGVHQWRDPVRRDPSATGRRRPAFRGGPRSRAVSLRGSRSTGARSRWRERRASASPRGSMACGSGWTSTGPWAPGSPSGAP